MGLVDEVVLSVHVGKTMRIAEAARRLGVSPITLRRYEARGLIDQARRDRNGRRVFSEQDLVAIGRILVPERSTGDGSQTAD